MSNFTRVDAIPEGYESDTEEQDTLTLDEKGWTRPGTVEVNGYNGQVIDRGVVEVKASDLSAVKDNGDIMSTAKTKHGNTITTKDQLNDDCIVTANGIEITIAQAKGMGLINDDYKDSGKTVSEAISKPAPKIESEDIVHYGGGQGRQMLNTVNAQIGEGSAFNIVNSVIEAFVGEDLQGRKSNMEQQVDRASKIITRETGAELSSSKAIAVEVYQSLYNGVANWCEDNVEGVEDGIKMMKWAKDNLKADERASILRSAYLGDIASLRHLANQYLHRRKYL